MRYGFSYVVDGKINGFETIRGPIESEAVPEAVRSILDEIGVTRVAVEIDRNGDGRPSMNVYQKLEER